MVEILFLRIGFNSSNNISIMPRPKGCVAFINNFRFCALVYPASKYIKYLPQWGVMRISVYSSHVPRSVRKHAFG